jgi:hypothetical protein
MLDTTSLQIMPRRRLDLGGLAMKALLVAAILAAPIVPLVTAAMFVTIAFGPLGLSDLACGLLAAYGACLLCFGLGAYIGGRER